jgi:cytochrome P450
MGQDLGCLHHQQYRNLFLDKVHSIFEEMSWLGKILFTVTRASLSSSPWIFKFVQPPTMAVLKELLKPSIEGYLNKRHDIEESRRSPIIEALYQGKTSKGQRAVDFENLCEEVVTLTTAGGDTTSSALILGIYQICRNVKIYTQLEEELMSSFSSTSPITYEQARRLPYLTVCIKEILRISNPLPGRLPRVAPPEGFELYGQHLLGGTIINSSAYLLNRHPSIWSEPDTFNPDRWLISESKNFEKYMASFYRGTRQCLGKEYVRPLL